MKRCRLALMLLQAMLIVGCAAGAGSTVIATTGESDITTTPATADGRYSLYGANDATPKVTYKINRNEPIGFRRDGDVVTAVAGTNQFPIGKRLGSKYE